MLLPILLAAMISLSGCVNGKPVPGAPAVIVTSPEPAKAVDAPLRNNIPPVESGSENLPAGAREKTRDAAHAQVPSIPAVSADGHAVNLKFPTPATLAYKDETIAEDTTWSGRVSIEGALTIAPQATVTISPGTVIAFRRTAGAENAAVLLVQGRIVAQGTSDQPIRFTGGAGDARSSSWQGIVFLASEKKNILEQCLVDGAETGIDAAYSTLTVKNIRFSGCRTGLRAQDCLLYMRECVASKCDLGISLYDCEVEITGGSLASNRMGIYAKRSSLLLSGAELTGSDLEALSVEESTVKIVGNTFVQNGRGIALSSCEGLVSGNRIVKNRDYGISLAGSRVKITANDISQNGKVGIRVGDGKAIAWSNIIALNGQYDLYNAGPENFKAVGNWWGEGKAPDSKGKVYDRAVNPRIGNVWYFPALRRKPAISP